MVSHAYWTSSAWGPAPCQHVHAFVLIVRGPYYGPFLGWWRGLVHLWDPEVKLKLQFIAELNT